MVSSNEQQMLRVRQAARMLGLTELAIRRAIGRSDIPAVRLGRYLLVPRSAIQAILEPKVLNALRR